MNTHTGLLKSSVTFAGPKPEQLTSVASVNIKCFALYHDEVLTKFKYFHQKTKIFVLTLDFKICTSTIMMDKRY